MAFRPDEILFSPTTSCNLACSHCNVGRSDVVLSVKAAKKFLIDCRKNGINRVGFTGGEPFLAGIFLPSIVKFAVKEGFLFTRIVTNGVWHKDSCGLKRTLAKLFDAGYDGSISISVDDYHKQSLAKLVEFIKTALSIWRRPDLISIIYVTGRNQATESKLRRLASLLKARLSGFGAPHAVIKSGCVSDDEMGFYPFHIKIARIDLSPIGKAAMLKDPWSSGKWFKDDLCKGPGNVFFVESSGDVRPCCGYAAGSGELTIGNIKKDPVRRLLKNIRQNPIVYDIFNTGLGRIRARLIKRGIVFRGKTDNNCFFCHYILTEVPRPALLKSLKG